MSAEGVAKCIKISNFILCILSIIAFLFFNVLSFKYKPYNEPNYKELKKNWESSPIKSISLKNEFSNGQISTTNEYNKDYLLKMFDLKYMDDSYDYEYLLKEDLSDKDYHPCGIDSLGNSLYLPNDKECPINEIEISNNPSASFENGYSTINLFDNYYLHYSNNNPWGYLITGFDIRITDKSEWDNGYDNREYKINNFPIIFGNKMVEFIFPTYKGYPAVYDTGYERRNLTEIYYILNDKTLRMSINIITFIINIILLVFTILILAKDNLLGLHVFNMILGITSLLLRLFVAFYLDSNEMFKNEGVFDFLIEKGENLGEFFSIICSAGYLLFYMVFFSATTTNNIYYYIVYIIRYGLNGEVCGYCKRKRKEKIQKEQYEFHREIENLNNKLKELEKEENEIKNENIRAIKEIEKYKKILENKKRNASNNIDINIQIVEEIEIEKKIKIFEESNPNEVESLNKLKNQINEIEKEINFYKFKKFQQLKNNGDE